MKITAKTLQQQTIEIEIDVQRTVLDLKKEISKILGGDYIVERQKLICAGIVLENDKTLESYNITEEKLVVVMLLRESSVTEQVTNTESIPQPQSTQRTMMAEDQITDIISDTLPQEVPSESTFLSGEEYNKAVDILVEMGFEREMVTHAMAASYNNPERAFDYLMNGIPDDVEVEGQQQQGNEPRASREVTSETVNQVLQLLRQNPALLQATLEQMGVTNPELLQQIRNNPEAFFNLMQQSHNNSNTGGNTNTNNNNAGNETTGNVTPQNLITPERLNEFRDSLQPRSADLNAPIDQNDPLYAVHQNLTQNERDAVERLTALGFDQRMALQAYIACEKDETMAANFLVSNNDDD